LSTTSTTSTIVLKEEYYSAMPSFAHGGFDEISSEATLYRGMLSKPPTESPSMQSQSRQVNMTTPVSKSPETTNSQISSPISPSPMPRMKAGTVNTRSAMQSNPSRSGSANSALPTYPYAILKDAKTRPADCDVMCLENYLSEEEFRHVFKMNRTEFSALPAWKKNAMKRPVQLI